MVRVVEIVGPAGAGKTSLFQALGCYSEHVRLGNFPDVRKVANAPFFISNSLRLLPSLFGLYRSNSRQLTRRELAWMSILNGWTTILRKESDDNGKVIVLDQGPVYLLAEMRLFGPEYLRQEKAERLWQAFYGRWANILYLIIWLDAANDVLLDRIRTRQQEHIMKTEPTTAVYEFLGRYRAEYDSILSNITRRRAGIKVLQFDTEHQSPQAIAKQSWSEICFLKERI